MLSHSSVLMLWLSTFAPHLGTYNYEVNREVSMRLIIDASVNSTIRPSAGPEGPTRVGPEIDESVDDGQSTNFEVGLISIIH